MGWVARVRQFVRGTRGDGKLSRVTVDRGDGLNVTADHFDGAGCDAFPLDTDYVLGVDTPGEDRGQAAGYADPINDPKTAKGERRIYGRTPSDGSAVNEVWLKADGTVLIDNDKGSVTIKPDGTIESTNGTATYALNPDGSIKGENSIGHFELLANGTLDLNTATIDPLGNLVCASIVTGAVTAGAVGAASVAASGAVSAGSIDLQGHTHSQDNDGNGDSQVETSTAN